MPAHDSISRRRWLAAAGMTGAGLLAPQPAHAAAGSRWTVDPTETWTPEFHGWGTSLAWWARLAGTFPEEILDDILAEIFGSPDGLQLNVVRYNIGGGENPEHHFLSHRAAVEGYLARDGTWNWSVDAAQRKVFVRARELGANVCEAFANSPPWWMTKSGSVTGDKQGRGNLRDDMIGPFASYLATVVRHYRDKAGIEFDSLTPVNEPLGNWWKFGNKQEGCVIPPQQQAKLIPATRDALDRLGLRTTVTGPEDNRTSQAIKSLSAYTRAAWNAISHVNTHTYHAEDRAALLRLARKNDKPVWMSEYGDGDRSGMPLAQTIIADLRDLRAGAWVYWQAIDAYGWGLLEHPAFGNRKTPPTRAEMPNYKRSAKFEVMRQFTRHLRPGCRIVASSEPQSVAGFDPKTRKLSLVLLNDGNKQKPLDLELPRGLLKGKILSGSLLRDGVAKAIPPFACENTTQPISLPPKTLAAFTIAEP